MQLATTLVLYLVVGLSVSAALYLADDRAGRALQAFRCGTAVLFWPIYLPVLLSGRASAGEPLHARVEPPSDRLATLIAQVETELHAALGSLDGWAEDVLVREHERLGELQAALAAQAARVRQMDALLAEMQRDERATDEAVAGTHDAAIQHDPRLAQCDSNRRKNLERLARVRQQTHSDLLGTLAWLRELVSMIHLAKFTGAPASRAEELVRQIAAAVEGISAVTWREEPSVTLPVKENLPCDSSTASTAC